MFSLTNYKLVLVVQTQHDCGRLRPKTTRPGKPSKPFMQFLYSMFSPEEPTVIESRSDGTALSSGGDVTDVSVNRSHLGWDEERGDDDSDNDNNDAMTCASGLTHVSGDSKPCAIHGQIHYSLADCDLEDPPGWDSDYDCQEIAPGRNDTAVAENPETAVPSNIGFYFGNWGKRTTKHPDLQDNIDLQIKRCPCGILGLTEAQMYHAEILRAPATKGEPEWEATNSEGVAQNKFLRRDSYKWLVARGCAAEAPLIAVRDTFGKRIEVIYQENKSHGKYTAKKKKKNKNKKKKKQETTDEQVAEVAAKPDVDVAAKPPDAEVAAEPPDAKKKKKTESGKPESGGGRDPGFRYLE